MLNRIAVIGPESTGKSDLCKALAQKYDTQWVPEFARYYLEDLNRPYNMEDLNIMAKGQMDWEELKAPLAKNFLFCDTNLIVFKVWSDHKYGYTERWIEDALLERNYAFYLLTQIDLPWREDPLREHPDLRQYFYEVFKNYLMDRDLPFAVISGMGNARIESAKEAIDNFFAK